MRKANHIAALRTTESQFGTVLLVCNFTKVSNIEKFDIPTPEPGVTDIEVFADEIKPFKNRVGETWLYIGLLIVPVRKKQYLLDRLLSLRRRIPCDSEIKCHDLDKSTKRILASKWVDVVLTDKVYRSVFFDILGLNLSRLNLPAFGDEQFANIYNRFFRTCVLHGVHSCFVKRKVRIIEVFHDKGEQALHLLFPWHCIYAVEGQSDRISFVQRQVKFIDSDHRATDGCAESHLIQLIDLFMGLSSHCLDFVSGNQARTAVAQKLLPLLERMMASPLNINSSYGHAHKYLISFFPKKTLTARQLLDPFERRLSGFYQKRPLLLRDHLSAQGSLFS